MVNDTVLKLTFWPNLMRNTRTCVSTCFFYCFNLFSTSKAIFSFVIRLPEHEKPCTLLFFFISRCESCNLGDGNSGNEENKTESFCKHSYHEFHKDYGVLHVSVQWIGFRYLHSYPAKESILGGLWFQFSNWPATAALFLSFLYAFLRAICWEGRKQQNTWWHRKIPQFIPLSYPNSSEKKIVTRDYNHQLGKGSWSTL